ncbi:hypothetical protein BDAP_002054 [Binucleata daphniae]
MGYLNRFKNRLSRAVTLQKLSMKDITFGTFMLDLLFFIVVETILIGSLTLLVGNIVFAAIGSIITNALSAVLLKLFAPKKKTRFTGLMTICLFASLYSIVTDCFMFCNITLRNIVFIAFIVASSIYYYNNLKSRGYKGFRLWFVIICRALVCSMFSPSAYDTSKLSEEFY